MPALRILFDRLTPARRKMLVPVLALMLVGALAEVATIGALVPLLGGITSPQEVLANPLLGLVALDSSNPLVLVALFAVVALVSAGLRVLLLWTSTSFVNSVAHELATKLYSDTLRESYRFHIGRNSSEIIAIVNKVQMLTWQVLHPLMTGVIALTVSSFIVAGLMIVDLWIALLAGGFFIVIYLGVSTLTRKRLKRNSVIIARAQEERIRAMQEGLGGIRDILLDQSQQVFVEVYDRAEARYRAASVKNTFLSGAPRYLVEAGGMITIAALAIFAAGRPGGLMEAIPTLGALALGAQRLMPLIQQLYSAWASIMGSRQIALDVAALLDRRVPSSAPVSALPFEQSISFRAVGFSYGPGAPSILSEVNLEIPKGSRVGIMGKTGSGKSTLVDIVLGLLEPSVGTVFIDGVPLTQETRRAWQRNVAHVPQAIYLADATIAENVAFGVPPHLIDRDRLHRAIEQADLANVVARLPLGYETRVGERGVQLSGGQRQRIGIARALYKQASVLVFDEATSALDYETESTVMESIERLARTLTIVIVAHRTSTLAACSRLLRVEGGGVTELSLQAFEGM